MGRVAWLLLLLAAAPVSGFAAPAGVVESAPSPHTLLYYNARMALREGNAGEAARLWLLRNALENQTGTVSAHDADFRSVTWAALGQLGVCQDGLRRDSGGAGLWPIALHNYVVRNLGRRPGGRRIRPFDTFAVGRQARRVAIGDVLSARELATVELSRGRCFRPRQALIASGEPPLASLSDRQVSARLLRALLEQARRTLVQERVRGRAAIEARLFDLDLQLVALAAREARQDAREASQVGRQLGLTSSGVSAMRAEAPASTLTVGSTGHRVLTTCVDWPVDEWMSVSSDRRLNLYLAARSYGGDPEKLRKIGLGVLDALILRGEGADVSRWIGQLVPEGDAAAQEVIWGGARGERLIGLGPESGFSGRAVVALHRGVDALSRGDLTGALRSFAFVREHAEESAAGASLSGLGLRWLGYVAAQFEVDTTLLVTLGELVPKRDFAVLLEDLMWSAAFHADLSSFEAGLASPAGRGALERRLPLLRPLAAGDSRQFVAQIRSGLTESPSETLRFLTQLVDRLELEDAEVRAAQVPTVRAVRRLLEPMTSEAAGRPGRMAEELIGRILAIEEGMGGVPAEVGARARALSPGSEVYAGSVRLAPADPLPWPFRAVEVAAPSVFEPIDLVPVEWRDQDGGWVFGWSVRG